MDEDLEKLEKEKDLETEEEVLEEGEVERSELDKEKGKWLMDISKYILTAFVFTFMLENIQNKFIANLIAAGFAVGVFLLGTRYLKTKEKKKSKKRKISTLKNECHGTSNRLFRYIRSRSRRTNRKRN
jgi:uncharacterized membrane protein YciS (DUF1049 family)